MFAKVVFRGCGLIIAVLVSSEAIADDLAARSPASAGQLALEFVHDIQDKQLDRAYQSLSKAAKRRMDKRTAKTLLLSQRDFLKGGNFRSSAAFLNSRTLSGSGGATACLKGKIRTSKVYGMISLVRDPGDDSFSIDSYQFSPVAMFGCPA